MESEDWFESWFNTPYYHLLYKQRDEKEVRFFIDQLLGFLQVPANAKILDLACGRGRHAKYMNTKGLDVTGLDLSKQNINYAQQYENEDLHFVQGDMRHNLGEENFDYVFNLFTSFGYFDTPKEHEVAVQSICNSLKPKGHFIVDFMNAEKVCEKLVALEEKVVEHIHFHIERYFENGKIIKIIKFEDKGKKYTFKEEVMAFSLRDFKKLFEKCGLKLLHTFGDFNLNAFDENISDRLILIAQKN